MSFQELLLQMKKYVYDCPLPEMENLQQREAVSEFYLFSSQLYSHELSWHMLQIAFTVMNYPDLWKDGLTANCCSGWNLAVINVK